MINKIRNKFSNLLKKLITPNDPGVHIEIERSWSTDTAIGIKGKVEVQKGTIDEMDVSVGGGAAKVTSWIESQARAASGESKGFWVQVPRKAKHSAEFIITKGDSKIRRTVFFGGSNPLPTKDFHPGDKILGNFIQRVNDQNLHVLEIGSRVLPPKQQGMRDSFPQAGSYTGFDFYPDSNTDVVGDAHKLSSYFNGKKFDAVFSIAVLEHIAMPWVVAMEINKILKTGGISCHQVPFAWPAHELPWDFWRCSDGGLKVLFSPSMGFKTIEAGMFAPLRMYFDTPIQGRERFPEFPCFGSSVILSKKTGEIDSSKFRWETDQEEILGNESLYPKLF